LAHDTITPQPGRIKDPRQPDRVGTRGGTLEASHHRHPPKSQDHGTVPSLDTRTPGKLMTASSDAVGTWWSARLAWLTLKTNRAEPVSPGCCAATGFPSFSST